MRPCRSRRTAVLLAALLILLAPLAACSGDDDQPPEPTQGLPSQADLATYFGAVAGYDVTGLVEAEGLAADGSPAQAYVRYLGLMAQAAIAGQQPYPAATAEETADGYRACSDAGAGEECAEWSDLRAEDGLLADFTVNGDSLDDILVDLSEQGDISPDGLFTVEPEFAYRSPLAGDLDIVVSVTATDIPLEVLSRRGIYVEQATIFKGADSRSAVVVEPDTTGLVILRFPDAGDTALDGEVTFDVTVGDADRQSIGFGLVAPAG